MSEDGAERKRRLKALKERASNKSIKFRNYRPQDAGIRQQALDSKNKDTDKGSSSHGGSNTRGDAATSSEMVKGQALEAEEDEERRKRQAPASSLIQQELKKQKETQDEEELNIAPKKANWDLKRDVEKKLEKLNRRTQRAIVEIIRERMAEEAANASSSEEEEEEEEGDGSGSSRGSSSSSSSGEEGSGSSSEDE